ncbi:extracellular solute-binding protein [Calidifontibacter terrae]
MTRTSRTHLLTTAVAGLGIALVATGCGSASGTQNSGKVAIVGFSVPKPAYDALGSAFAKTADGKGTTFSGSYAASGSQSKAVANGQKADYVAFSVGTDMSRLVPKFVAASWDTDANKGIVSSSVVVLVVKKGNPEHITGWADLVKPGVKIVTPDPASSGSAKWNILAAYEQAISRGQTPAQAKTYLSQLFKNVVSKPSSGADAMTTFTQGTGDVLLSYENEAIAARQSGLPVDYVVPPQSVLIENPGAVTTKASPAAKKFLSFVTSADGQKIFASKGYRPVNDIVAPGTVAGANNPANPFPKVAQLTTIADLGGWKKVNTDFFDKKTGIVTTVENASG